MNSLEEKLLAKVQKAAAALISETLEKRREKGIVKEEIRMLVFGIPNSGKSTFINNLSWKRSAKVGNRPGVTTQKQWIRTSGGLLLLDTPGVLWQRLEEQQGRHLAYTGAIRDEILELEELGYQFLDEMLRYYPTHISQRYNVETEGVETIEVLNAVAERIGAIRRAEVDYRRVAQALFDDFRKVRLGRLSLEKPENYGKKGSLDGRVSE